MSRATTAHRPLVACALVLLPASALVLGLGSGTAQAQDFPKVFVFPALDLPAGASTAGAAAVTAGLYKELSVSVPITLLKEVDAAAAKMPADAGAGAGAGAASGAGVPAAKTAAEAKSLLDEGKKAKTKDPAKAVELLKGAVASYETLLPDTKDFAALAEAHLELGDALFRSGLQDEGEERMKLAVAMVGKPASTAGLDATYKGLLDKRVTKMATKAPGSLKLTTTPPGATVTVDGKAAPGPSPVTVEGLPPGVHYVLVMLAGRKPKVEKVDIKGNETSELTVALDPEGGAAPAPGAAPAAAPKGRLPDVLDRVMGKGRINAEGRKVLMAFGKAAEAKYLVLPYFVPDGDVFFLRAYMMRVDDGAMVKFDEKIFAALDKMDKGVQQTAELVIKYAYAFPEAEALDKAATIVVPVPEAKVAKSTKSSAIDEGDGGGGSVDDCDPEVDDCPPKKIHKKSGTHKVKKGAARTKKSKAGLKHRKPKVDDDDCDPEVDDCEDDGALAVDGDGDDGDGDGGGGGGGIHFKLPTNKWYFWVGVGAVGVVIAGAIVGGAFLASRDGVNAIVTWGER
ncbi:MAG TPA: PEGA domain-containing protein [Myxococcota bacterium]|jgi:hypothetical protein|nr:PEGA domain-containing protein [Myxococcota bacterium]